MANNGTTSSKISQNILDAFEIIAKAEVGSAQFDKTVVGIIISCEDETTGKYRVQYQDSIFYAYASALDVTYTKGTSVQVRIPNNDFSGRKIIIGTAAENGIDYGTTVEDPLTRYENIGADCFNSNESFGLCSYKTQTITLYERNSIDRLGINSNLDIIRDNMNQGDSVLLGATIHTELESEQKLGGNYGIVYTLAFKDITNVNEDKILERTYIIDIDKMSGDPYNYKEPATQIVPFDVDGKNFLYISKVGIFAERFPNQDNSKPDDIFIENIRFQVANRLSEEEYAGTALIILTPEGNYFDRTGLQETKPAIAQVRIRGKTTSNVTRQIAYYWFREDLTVNKTDNVDYNKYGGRGWRCINDFNVISGTYSNPTEKSFITNNDTLQVKEVDTNARDIKYKCVAVYNGVVLEKEFSFINYDINIDVIIESDRGTSFIDGLGATTLTAKARQYNSSTGNWDIITADSYIWATVDADGGFTLLTNTDPANIRNDIQASSIYNNIIYKCQIIKNNKSLGVANITLINKNKEGEDESTGQLTILNGGQVFKYDANGIAPNSLQLESPQIILPLSFVLRTAEGVEVPDTAIRDSDVSWIVPTTNTMIKTIGTPDDMNVDDETVIYKGKTLSYNISENYYTKKDNNDIELQVKYQNILYVERTKLLFTKDGENGTNGTDYVLRLIPKDNNNGRLYTVTPGESGTDWIRAELWYNGIRIFNGYKNGNASTTGKAVTLTWSIVGDKRSTHNITVTSNGANPPQWNAVAAAQYSSTATDIAKLVVNYDGKDIVATIPIIYSVDLNKNDYLVSLKENTGFTHVIYTSAGNNPQYDGYTPFELKIQKKINGSWEEYSSNNLNYVWTYVGKLKFKAENNPSSVTTSSVMMEPVGVYDSEQTNNAIICTVRDDNIIIGTFHIPIHFMLNHYENKAINGWDGNSIQLDAAGNTMLLAPQAGFGDKNTNNNSYNGVLLGTVKTYNGSTVDVTKRGLLGYYNGEQTLFLNSDDGSAIFGRTKGQIIIDPKSEKALIYSSGTEGYWKNYDNYGKPINYSIGNENGKGMLIDLTTPQIKFGNGNFIVNSSGHLTAKGGGTIAGWNITDTALTKGAVSISSDNSVITNWAFRVGTNNNTATFGVQYNGFTLMQTAQIGSGSNRITIGKENNSTTNSAIYYGNKNSLISNANGFYLGNNGLALGGTTSYTTDSGTETHSKFEVLADGTLYANNGNFKGRINSTSGIIGGFTINSTAIIATNGNYYVSLGNISNGNKDFLVVRTGTEGSYDYPFYVRGDGTLHATKAEIEGKITASTGKIGNWEIVDGRIENNKYTSAGFRTGMQALDSAGSAAFYAGVQNASGGIVSESTKFFVTQGGYLWAQDANIKGTITATSGSFTGTIEAGDGHIGGYTITSNRIQSNSEKVGLSSETWAGCPSIWAGRNPWEAGQHGDWTELTPFYVTNEGYLKANKGKIANWTIETGKLSATGESGQVAAIQAPAAGNFWTFAAGGTTHSSYGDCPFRVSKNGDLYATTAHITGEINATSGTFNNVTITDTCSINGAAITNASIGSAKIDSLNGSKIVDGTVSNAKIDTMAASKLTSGTVDTNNFSVKTNVGYIRAGTGVSNPYVSALNVGYGSGGISFRDGSTIDDVGSQVGNIQMDLSSGKNVMYLRASGGINLVNGGLRVTSSQISTPKVVADALETSHFWIGDQVINADLGAQISMGRSITLYGSSSGAVYAGGTSASDKVMTAGGTPSSLKIKRNVKEKDTSNILRILDKIKLYEYDYIPEIENGKHDYGYIIDYLERIPDIDKYFNFEESEYNRTGITSKRVSTEHLIKFLLGAVVELNKQLKRR